MNLKWGQDHEGDWYLVEIDNKWAGSKAWVVRHNEKWVPFIVQEGKWVNHYVDDLSVEEAIRYAEAIIRLEGVKE